MVPDGGDRDVVVLLATISVRISYCECRLHTCVLYAIEALFAFVLLVLDEVGERGRCRSQRRNSNLNHPHARRRDDGNCHIEERRRKTAQIRKHSSEQQVRNNSTGNQGHNADKKIGTPKTVLL